MIVHKIKKHDRTHSERSQKDDNLTSVLVIFCIFLVIWASYFAGGFFKLLEGLC